VQDRLAQGHRAAAIAEEFVVSLTTVRSQIRGILAKLGSDRTSKPSRWCTAIKTRGWSGEDDPRYRPLSVRRWAVPDAPRYGGDVSNDHARRNRPPAVR